MFIAFRVSLYLLLALLFCFTMGSWVDSIASRHGFVENWFWWGFFLGFLAMLMAHFEIDLNKIPNKIKARKYRRYRSYTGNY